MEVVIKQGVLKGLRNKTLLSNKPYFSFLGIPYAKAPVNDLRFKVNSFVHILYSQLQLVLTLKFKYIKIKRNILYSRYNIFVKWVNSNILYTIKITYCKYV